MHTYIKNILTHIMLTIFMHNTTYIPLYFTFDDDVITYIHVFMISIQFLRLSLGLLLIIRSILCVYYQACVILLMI